MPSARSLGAAAVAAGALAAPVPALSASVVRSAGPTDRAALIRALVRQDGSSAGVSGVYLSRAQSSLGVVCQRTPDSGKVSYVFKRRGRAWAYVTDNRSAKPRSAVQRGLEHAC